MVDFGGYDCDVVEELPDNLICPICKLLFRDPHLISCCGAKFCSKCISRVKTDNNPCPICKHAVFKTMLDHGDKRKVEDLRVRCSSFKEYGCQWEGELRDLIMHQRENCRWQLVSCTLGCKAKIHRHLLESHKLDDCPERSLDEKLESLRKQATSEVLNKMAAIKDELETMFHNETDHYNKELENKIAEDKRRMEIKMAEQKREMERQMAEQKKEMEIKIDEQKREMEKKMAEQKEEMEIKINEQRRQIEHNMAEQKGGIESKMDKQIQVSLNARSNLFSRPCKMILGPTKSAIIERVSSGQGFIIH